MARALRHGRSARSPGASPSADAVRLRKPSKPPTVKGELSQRPAAAQRARKASIVRFYGGAVLLVLTLIILGVWGVVGKPARVAAVRLLGGVAGVSPGFLLPFGHKGTSFPRWYRQMLLIALPSVTIFVAAIPWIFQAQLTPPPLPMLPARNGSLHRNGTFPGNASFHGGPRNGSLPGHNGSRGGPFTGHNGSLAGRNGSRSGHNGSRNGSLPAHDAQHAAQDGPQAWQDGSHPGFPGHEALAPPGSPNSASAGNASLYPRRFRKPGPVVVAHAPPFKLLGVVFNAAILPVALASVWTRPPPSTYIRDAIRCVLSLWFLMLVWAIYGTVVIPLAWNYKYVHDFYRSFTLHFEGLVIFGWTSFMMVRRYQALENSSTLATRHAGNLVGAMAIAFQIAQSVLTLYDTLSKSPASNQTYLLFVATFQAIWTFYVLLLARTILRSFLLVRREMQSITGAPRAEAAWAAKVLSIELLATPLGITVPILYYAEPLVKLVPSVETQMRLRVAVCVLHRADLVLTAVSVALLSGLLGHVGKPKMIPHAGSSEDLEHGAREEYSNPAEEWKNKVNELALRAVKLGDLLGFWNRLITDADLMPGFDSQRSTTNDVVRRAIIPMSRHLDLAGGGIALASVWAGGEDRPAECMVTHNWSNLFWHLVAAIVADAVGEDVFKDVANKMLTPQGVAELRTALEHKGTLDRTYWVCAFSINQHAGICGGFGREPPPGTADHEEWNSKRCDSVTQVVFPVCTCTQPKIFNDQPALCEMNKFDDMMRLLHRTITGFSHLVVVDAQFDVFTRAWCVAEIVESHMSGIPQRIMIHSQEKLDEHYLSLSQLDVRECKASRVEDRDMILANIKDIDRFNSDVQWAIFGTKGLFQKWVDGQERSALIARILRRARTNVTMSTVSTMSTMREHSTMSTNPSMRSSRRRFGFGSRMDTATTFSSHRESEAEDEDEGEADSSWSGSSPSTFVTESTVTTVTTIDTVDTDMYREWRGGVTEMLSGPAAAPEGSPVRRPGK